MAKMVEITCKCGCGRKKMVRVADRKRGWGLYYSKSCKAKAQERCTGQYRRYNDRSNDQSNDYWDDYLDSVHPFSTEGLGQDGMGWA